MISMVDVLKEINKVGWISLTSPSKLERESRKHHAAIAPYSEVVEARRLYSRGVSMKEISIRLGRSRFTIQSWIYHGIRKGA
jgi:DNA-binding NarL/FixJ family response regulator